MHFRIYFILTITLLTNVYGKTNFLYAQNDIYISEDSIQLYDKVNLLNGLVDYIDSLYHIGYDPAKYVSVIPSADSLLNQTNLKIDSIFTFLPDSVKLNWINNQYLEDISNKMNIDPQIIELGKVKELNSISSFIDSVNTVKQNINIEREIVNKFNHSQEFEELNNYQQQLSELEKAFAIEENDGLRIIKDEADEFIMDQELLSKAIKKVEKLKNRYKNLLDEDSNTGIRANSLKNDSTERRFKYGGSFQVHRGNPIGVDLSPILFYRFNKVCRAGISLTYRFSTGLKVKNGFPVMTDMWSTSVIFEHDIYKGFFGSLELNVLSIPKSSITETSDIQCTTAILIGIGRKFMISRKIEGNLIFQYDVHYKENSLFKNSPYQLRFRILR